MKKYDTEATALKALTKGKKPSCVAALEAGFWQARKDGLDIREASEKSEFLHFISAHDGLNHGSELENGASTDEEIYATLEKIATEAVEQGDPVDQVEELNKHFRRWYDLYRSWGGDVFLSYVGAANIVHQIFNELNDVDEAEAIKVINEVPSEELKEIIFKEFYSLRNDGETVRGSLEAAVEKADQHQRVQALFTALSSGRLSGGKGDLIN